MIPDCLLPPVGRDVRVDLRHLVTLSLGPAMDMSDSVPAPNLDRALCPNSLAPTLSLQRREYWEEINPLLAKCIKRQRHPLPGVCEDDTCKHGPSPTTGAFRLCLLLAVPGRQLLLMVYLGT